MVSDLGRDVLSATLSLYCGGDVGGRRRDAVSINLRSVVGRRIVRDEATWFALETAKPGAQCVPVPSGLLSRAGTTPSAIGILSVRPSVCLSVPLVLHGSGWTSDHAIDASRH